MFKVVMKKIVKDPVKVGDFLIRSDGQVYKAIEAPANTKYGFSPSLKDHFLVVNLNTGVLWSSQCFKNGTSCKDIEDIMDKGRTLQLIAYDVATVTFDASK